MNNIIPRLWLKTPDLGRQTVLSLQKYIRQKYIMLHSFQWPGSYIRQTKQLSANHSNVSFWEDPRNIKGPVGGKCIFESVQWSKRPKPMDKWTPFAKSAILIGTISSCENTAFQHTASSKQYFPVYSILFLKNYKRKNYLQIVVYNFSQVFQ